MGAHSAEDIRKRWSTWPADAREKLVEIELELDELHPGWRAKEPFHRFPYDRLARTKWLLKRHAMLSRTSAGIPDPQDWEVIIVRDGRNPNKCYAHPVLPKVHEANAVTREPPRLSDAAWKVPPMRTLEPFGQTDRQAAEREAREAELALLEQPEPSSGLPPEADGDTPAALAETLGLDLGLVQRLLASKPKSWRGTNREWVDNALNVVGGAQ